MASALSAAFVVAVALVVAGAALVILLGQSLHGSATANADRRENLMLYRVENSPEDEPNKKAFEAVDSLTSDDDLAQILVDYPDDGKPAVIEGSTPAAGNDAPLAHVQVEGTDPVTTSDVTVTRSDGTTVHAVLSVGRGTLDGVPVTVLFAQPLTSVTEATDYLLFYLLFGVPILILVVGAATYFFSGRALRPVEAIRRRVAAMSEKDLDQRVPVPAAHDEIRRLADTMNAMIGRLQDAQGVQRRFVADASHELRSPLATIAAGLELLQRDTTDPATVAALRRETERVNRLVEGLLLLARADERGLQPRREEVDLDEIADAEQGRPAERGVRVVVRAEPVRVIGDRGQLVRVLRNLVDNARRHARSQVLVTVGRDGDPSRENGAVLDVADDGPGVPAADRARVFERFVRLDDARARSDGGSGLGLAIVAEVVAAHGGTVELHEAPGGGALFRVRMPAVTAFAEVEAPAVASPTAAAGPAAVVPEAAGPPAPAPRPVPRHRAPARGRNGIRPGPAPATPPQGSDPVHAAEPHREPETIPWARPADQGADVAVGSPRATSAP
jgi:signal transduction histidine kinase